MSTNHPLPNNPPFSYRIDAGEAVFFRRVNQVELECTNRSGCLVAEPGGMGLGKHLTTTIELAREWGKALVKRGWEQNLGHVLEVRILATIAEEIDFVGVKVDGIGPCYFASFEQLKNAKLSEVHL